LRSAPQRRRRRSTALPQGRQDHRRPALITFASEAEAADADIFGVEIILDALMPTLAAEAGLLDATERRLGRGDDAFIDADHAVFQPLHDAEGAAEIAGVEIAGEAVFGVVGEIHRLLLGLEAEDGRDRAEDLFLGETHLRRRPGDHGRLEEGAAERVALAAGDDLAALGGS